MRRSHLFTLAALVVALIGCDAAGPGATLSDAKPDRAGFLVRTLDANGNASERRQDKVAVCHYDDEAGTYERIEVGAPALDAHLRNHPDGVPGGEVPEADAPSTFDDDCAVVPDAPGTCSVEYGVDDQGRPTVTVTAVLTDESLFPVDRALTTVSPGADLVQGSVFANPRFIRNEDGVTIGFAGQRTVVDEGAAADDLITLELLDVLEDNTTTAVLFTCGPYPVLAPDPS